MTLHPLGKRKAIQILVTQKSDTHFSVFKEIFKRSLSSHFIVDWLDCFFFLLFLVCKEIQNMYSEISWQVAQLQVKEKVRTLWPVDPRDFRFAFGKGSLENCLPPQQKQHFHYPQLKTVALHHAILGVRTKKLSTNTEVFCEHQNHFALTYSWWKKALYHLRMFGNQAQIIVYYISIRIISDNILWLL